MESFILSHDCSMQWTLISPCSWKRLWRPRKVQLLIKAAQLVYSSSGFKPSDSDLEALGLLSGGCGERRRPVTPVGQGRHLPIEARIRLQRSVPMTQALRAPGAVPGRQTPAAVGSLPTDVNPSPGLCTFPWGPVLPATSSVVAKCTLGLHSRPMPGYRSADMGGRGPMWEKSDGHGWNTLGAVALVVPRLIPTTTLEGKCNLYSCFTTEEGVREGKITLPRSVDW